MGRVRALMPLLVMLSCWHGSAYAQPPVDTEEVPGYDYSQTHKIILYGDEGHVYLAHPFDYPAPSYGALVYEMILLYVREFREIIIPPVEPTHVIDLLMADRYGRERIGQRLYMGDAWLSDGKAVAFMKPEDYRRLTGLLHDRYTAGEPSGARLVQSLRRPTEDELPENWLPEEASIEKAVSRMVSDYEYEGYDPGAVIRRRATGSSGGYAPGDAPETDAQRTDTQEPQHQSDISPKPEQSPRMREFTEPRGEEDGGNLETSEAKTTERLFQSQENQAIETLTDSDPKNPPPDDSGRRLFLIAVTVATFLLVRLLSRKLSRKNKTSQ